MKIAVKKQALRLHKETLRTLSSTQLMRVAGGGDSVEEGGCRPPSDDCPSPQHPHASGLMRENCTGAHHTDNCSHTCPVA